MIVIALVAMLNILYPGSATAECIDSVAVEILFPVKQTKIDPNFKGNDSRLQTFIDRIKALGSKQTLQIGSICISGYTSPEGGHEQNQQLARERAASMAEYLRNHLNVADSLISIRYTGIDWQGLYRAVEASTLQNKAKVLDIISNEPEITYGGNGKVQTRSRKQQLMKLEGGRVWMWMLENVYPQLRSSASVVCYIETVEQEDTECEEPPLAEPTETTPVINEDADDIQPVQPTNNIEKYPPRQTIFALRTNALLPLLNVGAELPIGNRWSIGADYYYPWAFRKSNHKECFQLTFFSGEARYWFGKNRTKESRLLGHSIATYGVWGYFDFEHNYSGHQGEFWSAGADYMYAVPIFKGKLHLEFQIAAGVIYSHSQPYDVFVVGGNAIRDRLAKKKFSYVGPTKIGISVVLPFKVKIK